MTQQKILFGWSGGKDSALALHEIRRSGQYEIAALVTTITEDYDRISMHGVRCGLLDRQAEELRLPLKKIGIPKGCSNGEYDARMQKAFGEFKRKGITTVAFGDLFLEDIRAYRDRLLGEIGMRSIYPIWGRETKGLARSFVLEGFKAYLVCVDPRVVPSSFAGRELDESLLEDLPAGVDPCGENGEFHTFVFQGPVFRNAIPCQRGEVVLRDGFCFCDLLAVTPNSQTEISPINGNPFFGNLF